MGATIVQFRNSHRLEHHLLRDLELCEQNARLCEHVARESHLLYREIEVRSLHDHYRVLPCSHEHTHTHTDGNVLFGFIHWDIIAVIQLLTN